MSIPNKDNKAGYTVGDEIYFRVGYGDAIEISKITKITPSGRLICGNHTLNPNLKVRGGGGFGSPYQGYPVTDVIRKQYKHQQLVSYFGALQFKKLSLESLSEMKHAIKDLI